MNTTEIDQVFSSAQQIAADGLNEYQREQQAIRSNFERLRSERLAREAAKSSN